MLGNEVLLQDIIERRMKVKASRGRKRLHMLSDVASSAKYPEVKRVAEDRGMDSYILTACSSLLYALHVLRSRGLPELSVKAGHVPGYSVRQDHVLLTCMAWILYCS